MNFLRRRPSTLLATAAVVTPLVVALLCAACSTRPTASVEATTAPATSPTTEAEPLTTTTPPKTPPPATLPVATAPVTTAASGAPRAATLRDADCRFAPPGGYEVRCFDLVVPQDRAKAGGPDVTLAGAVFHLPASSGRGDPLLYLDGGPGSHALAAAELAFDSRFATAARDRDVIIFDQRGTGLSTPALDCSELTDVFEQQLTTPRAPTNLAQQRGALARCVDRWQRQGYDLAAFNSVESAADVADLRRALGIPQWDVLGVSYGTRLALTVLRTQPEGVRSVVLDSTYPPEVDATAEFPDRTWAAFGHLFEACRSDPHCAQDAPNLASRFWALARQLDAAPLRFRAAEALQGRPIDVALDGSSLVGLVFEALYSPDRFVLVPRLVAELERSDATTAARLIGASVAQSGFLSVGDYVAVQCHEELALSDRRAVEDAAQRHPELAAFVAEQLVDGPAGYATCELANVGRAPQAEAAPVNTSVPMLVMAGEFDPVTPPQWGEAVANRNPRAFFAAFPGLGHGVSLGEGCPNDVFLAFLLRPDQPPDLGCRGAMESPAWRT